MTLNMTWSYLGRDSSKRALKEFKLRLKFTIQLVNLLSYATSILGLDMPHKLQMTIFLAHLFNHLSSEFRKRTPHANRFTNLLQAPSQLSLTLL
jgi:hypothetical protein